MARTTEGGQDTFGEFGGGGFSCSMLFGVGSCVYERATTVLGPPVD